MLGLTTARLAEMLGNVIVLIVVCLLVGYAMGRIR